MSRKHNIYLLEDLTTTEILYYMPDYPLLLQSFLWQVNDVAPEFPRVHRFLRYWHQNIHAVICSVSIASRGLVVPVRDL